MHTRSGVYDVRAANVDAGSIAFGAGPKPSSAPRDHRRASTQDSDDSDEDDSRDFHGPSYKAAFGKTLAETAEDEADPAADGSKQALVSDEKVEEVAPSSSSGSGHAKEEQERHLERMIPNLRRYPDAPIPGEVSK